MAEKQLEEYKLKKGNLSDGIPLIEPEDKDRLQKELQKLEEKYKKSVEEGNDENAAKYDQDMKDFTDYLSKIFDKDGQPRVIQSPIEKARLTIYNNINRQLKKIKKDCPALFDHLIKKKCLRTGTTFSYAPPPQHKVDWEISY